MDKRFIEVSFPVKEVSEISAKEKNIRHGHISTLHIWWTRKPLGSSRATSYAALIPAPKNPEEWEKKRQFIIDLARWESSLNEHIIGKARKDILSANGGKPLRVLDPFAGGGSIPVEALRLGCEVHAVEYNPVATLILRCTLEYPQKYGKPKEVKAGERGKKSADLGLSESKTVNPLLEDVKKWGDWVLKEAKKEIGKFYPNDPDGSIPVGYYWMRTIPCQNPSCGAEIPLTANLWLAKKSNKKVALQPYVEKNEVKFRIVADGPACAADIAAGRYAKMPSGFDPARGTVSRAVATCLVCGSMVEANTTRKLFQQGKAGQRMVAVVLHKPGSKGKHYRLATDKDLKTFKEAEKYLEKKRAKLAEEWGIDPVPDEDIPIVHTITQRPFAPRENYGFLRWGDLFNSRQKLSLITFVEKVRAAHSNMLAEGYKPDYAGAVVSYLSLVLSRHSSYNSTLCWWEPIGERGFNVFGRQALPMVFDHAEQNPFGNLTGNWDAQAEIACHIVQYLVTGTTQILVGVTQASSPLTTVTQGSATELPYPDNHFDAVFTDPPYYDNVPYSYLSDFFYVWLKRAVGDMYPDLFMTPLTPKSKEIVAYSRDEDGFEAGKRFFETMLKKAFEEIARVLKPNGIATIVYTHKSTSGWETLINSLLDSGLVVTASWPVDTEMKTRLRANESAALASSIYFVCRKMERAETGWLNEVKEEIKQHIYQKLERLWGEGISGADYFISAIGSAIEIFGRYEKIMDFEGSLVKADRLLEYVREIVTDYAVRQILHNGIAAELSPLTRFYILWRWTYGEAKVHFDDARKLAQSTGIALDREWNRGFILKEKEFIRVLGPQERKLEELEDSDELIDILHAVLLLWKAGAKRDMKTILEQTGYGRRDSFYRVAQAISETLPTESREKKLLDGFLSGKDKLMDEIKDATKQGGLFE